MTLSVQETIAQRKAQGHGTLVAYLPVGYPDLATSVEASIAVLNWDSLGDGPSAARVCRARAVGDDSEKSLPQHRGPVPAPHGHARYHDENSGEGNCHRNRPIHPRKHCLHPSQGKALCDVVSDKPDHDDPRDDGDHARCRE